jgi:putative PIN family toxin of toxin-antitoxin system
MNALIDTNVLLSAALRDRLPERVVLFVAMHDDWRWIVTPEILAEYVEVLARPKFQLSTETLGDWTATLDLRTVNVGSPPAVPDFPRDPKDAPFLAAALACHADFLITGDQDLLQAKDILSTRIVTVADFASEFQIAE